jgi:mono/diheme cytochrome c family protein
MNARVVFVFSLINLIVFLFLITSCAGPTEKLYLEKCSDCHGENGTGKKANIDFTRQKFSAEKIRNSIVHGKGEMANITGIEEPELTQLITYVKSFYKEQ